MKENLKTVFLMETAEGLQMRLVEEVPPGYAENTFPGLDDLIEGVVVIKDTAGELVALRPGENDYVTEYGYPVFDMEGDTANDIVFQINDGDPIRTAADYHRDLMQDGETVISVNWEGLSRLVCAFGRKEAKFLTQQEGQISFGDQVTNCPVEIKHLKLSGEHYVCWQDESVCQSANVKVSGPDYRVEELFPERRLA